MNGKLRKECEQNFPHFWYWPLTLKYEWIMLSFAHCVKIVKIRSYFWSVFSCYRKIRTRNNSILGQFSRIRTLNKIESLLSRLSPLDHINHACWLSIHLMDMLPLHQTNSYFENGLFVVRKTKNQFFSIGIDNAHEQSNKCVK